MFYYLRATPNQWEVTGTGDYSLTNNVLTWLTNPCCIILLEVIRNS